MAAPSDMNEIYLSSSPHLTKGGSTAKVMLMVIIAMLPLSVFGIIKFGIPALVTILTSVISAVLAEFVFQKLTKQTVRIFDLSAVVTGLLLALVLPPTTPCWQTALGAIFGIVVAKGMFGGIGQNPFNPALTGRAFLFISFPTSLGVQWLQPGTDAISSATILSKLEEGSFTPKMSDVLQYFLGDRAGCIGETAIFLIILAFIFLLVIDVIDWRAPAGMVSVVIVATAISAAVKGGDVVTNVLFALVSGGLLFGATFMVTDYSTTPVTAKGRFIFGCGCGLITFLIRTFGGYPEGVMFSILIMNCFAPFLNKLTQKKYGYVKPVKGGKK